MSAGDSSAGFWRQVIAALAAVVVAAIGVGVWRQLKIWSLAGWSEFSFSICALFIGLGIGLVMRLCRGEGSFGLAGFAAFLVMLAGVAGGALQHEAEVNRRLHAMVAAAYRETLEFARLTDKLEGDSAMLRVLTNSDMAVVGRIAEARWHQSPDDGFWETRNLIHLHWVAARQIVIYGQGGVDRTIWEATRLWETGPFFDDVVRGEAKQPVSDEDLELFRTNEQTMLKRLLAGEVTREAFEASVYAKGRSQVHWSAIVFHGLGPFLGLFTLAGAVAAYRIVRPPSETEIV